MTQNHEINHKPVGLPQWASWCSHCEQMFSSKITRRKHQRDHHYVCKQPRCGAYLYTKETYINHYYENHADGYCERCDLFWTSSQELESHLLEEHSYCRKCKTVFSSDETRAEDFLNANPYAHAYCRTCNLDLPDGVSLSDHLDAFHSPPKPGDAPSWSDPYWSEKAKEKKRKHQDNSDDENEGNREDAPSNHYRTLGIDPSITHEQLLVIAKQKRCEAHPDRFAGRNLSPAKMEKVIATSKNVGWAADILCNPATRQEYDSELQAWKMRREEAKKRRQEGG